jgi:hypothetical protein
MTSVFNGATKTNVNDIGFYINVGSLYGQINYLNTVNGALSLSTANWASCGPNSPGGAAGNVLMSTTTGGVSLTTSGGAILKDLGKTVVSSLRTFRKVQLVRHNTNVARSTFGVAGQAATTGEDYLTGYIELGFEGNGTPAPVAHFGR